MGLLRLIFGEARTTETVMLNGGREVEVVGESHYQSTLERAAGDRQYDGVSVDVVATLVPEPSNKYDKDAIAVQVGGRTVGYLSRGAARSYGPLVRRLHGARRLGQCRATIIGGWDRSPRDRGQFGIWLDLATPARALPPAGE